MLATYVEIDMPLCLLQALYMAICAMQRALTTVRALRSQRSSFVQISGSATFDAAAQLLGSTTARAAAATATA